MKLYYLMVLLFIFSFSITGFTQGSWNIIPNAPTIGRIDDISFANDSVGFVSSEGLTYRTLDKGNTWNSISVLDTFGSYVRSIEFLNDSVGFAGLLEAAYPLLGNLYLTTNGGFDWTLLQNMQILPLDGICGMAHFGNRLVAVGTFSGPPWFYKTDDFGNTWTKVDLSSLASGLVDCYMISQDTILISGIADSVNQLGATILQSTDGGVNWQRVYLSSTYYSYVWKMFFNPSGLGVASVSSWGAQMQTIARTTDNGNTWSTINLDTIPFTADLGGIGMLNDSLGWIADQGGTGTWETQDGGISWNEIVSPIFMGDRMVKVDSVSLIATGITIYKYEIGSVSIPSPPTVRDENSHALLVYPNPAKDAITIEAVAITNTSGVIDILDEKGIRVMQVTRQNFPKGKNSFPVNLKNLSAGNYKVIWHKNEKLMVKSFAIVR